jgi:hypothetical protein
VADDEPGGTFTLNDAADSAHALAAARLAVESPTDPGDEVWSIVVDTV